MRKRSEVDNERARSKRRLRQVDEDERASRAAKKRAQVVQERERSSEREAADDEDGEFLRFGLGVWFATVLIWVGRRVACETLVKTFDEETRCDSEEH